MNQTVSSRLYRRITRLRWQAPVLAFLLVLAHQIVEHTVLAALPLWQHFISQMLFYGLVGPALAWWALTSLRNSVTETEKAEKALKEAHQNLQKINQRLTFLLQANHTLAQAEDEEALVAAMLELPLQVVPAVGCSLIRFNERQHPVSIVHRGEVTPEITDIWAEHLADAFVSQQCARCTSLTAVAGIAACPLLDRLPGNLPVHKVYCLKLARNNQDYGVLALYLADEQHPTGREKSLLIALAQEMSLVLESQYLRGRELNMLSRLQRSGRLRNLRHILRDVLAETVAALEADGAVLFVPGLETAELQAQTGQEPLLAADLNLVKGMAEGAGSAGTPLIIRDLEREDTRIRSLLAAPLCVEDRVLGHLALWATHPDTFTRRHAQLVSVVAGQAALLVENQRLYLRGEHRAVLAERARLAREIHDGLAQTLGYLKLRVSLIASWLREGKTQPAVASLEEVRRLLNDVSVDAREAIDGLHLRAGDADLPAWSSEIIAEFEMLSSIPVVATAAPEVEMPLEIHVQLQRIVQEALSNIRKHADATRAWVEWRADDQWLALEIRDNGRGFDPDDVPPIARHGLRIMQERAELLEAEFQITSQPDHGTRITLTLPLRKTVGEEKYG